MNYERLTRRLRQRIFDYDGTPKEAKAARILEKAVAKKCEQQEAAMTPEERQARETRQILAKNPWLTALDLM